MTTSPTFTSLSTVAIPVTDQDRTRALLETLGFECRLDAELRQGFRWVEVAPSSGSTSIDLVVSGDELPTGIDTGIRLVTTNARAPTPSYSSWGCRWANSSTGTGCH